MKKPVIDFYYIASVSKSLLIVLGTLLVVSLPAMNDREKRNAKMRFSPSVYVNVRVPAMSVYRLPWSNAGRAGIRPAPPARLLQRLISVNDVTQVMLSLMCDRSANCTVRRFALVKAHGFIPLPAVVMRHMPNLDLPAVLVSLDNSFPPNSGRPEAVAL